MVRAPAAPSMMAAVATPAPTSPSGQSNAPSSTLTAGEVSWTGATGPSPTVLGVTLWLGPSAAGTNAGEAFCVNAPTGCAAAVAGTATAARTTSNTRGLRS